MGCRFDDDLQDDGLRQDTVDSSQDTALLTKPCRLDLTTSLNLLLYQTMPVLPDQPTPPYHPALPDLLEHPAQLGQPDVEDCSDGVISDKAEPMPGKKKILVPVLNTMNKYLFDNYRLPMYSYINRQLRYGKLSRIVGARVQNKGIKKDPPAGGCVFQFHWQSEIACGGTG